MTTNKQFGVDPATEARIRADERRRCALFALETARMFNEVGADELADVFRGHAIDLKQWDEGPAAIAPVLA